MPTSVEPAEKAGKPSLFYKRHETKITQAEVVIIFLALIRTITSYYLLKRPGNILPVGHVDEIITGSLVAALFCLALTLLSSFGRHRVMHAVFALAIISLVLIKILYTG